MNQDDKNALADALATKFNRGERRTLVNELGSSSEDVTLRAATARDEAWEIVMYFERRGELERLEAKVEERRPGPARVAVPDGIQFGEGDEPTANLTPKYYIYVSETKLSMLWPQVSTQTRTSLPVQQQITVVTKFLESTVNVNDAHANTGYIKGCFDARALVHGYATLFRSYPNSVSPIVGLSCSTKHLLGAPEYQTDDYRMRQSEQYGVGRARAEILSVSSSNASFASNLMKALAADEESLRERRTSWSARIAK